MLKCNEIWTLWCDLDVLQFARRFYYCLKAQGVVKRSSSLNSNEWTIPLSQLTEPSSLLWRIKRGITERTVMLHNDPFPPGNVLISQGHTAYVHSSAKCTQRPMNFKWTPNWERKVIFKINTSYATLPCANNTQKHVLFFSMCHLPSSSWLSESQETPSPDPSLQEMAVKQLSFQTLMWTLLVVCVSSSGLWSQ